MRSRMERRCVSQDRQPSSSSKIYTFKPLTFKEHIPQSLQRPKARSGHRIACDENHLYSYGGYNPRIPNEEHEMRNNAAWLESRPLFKEVWKLNLLTQKWTLLPGQSNMPKELASNALVLRGSKLLIYGGTGNPFGQTCSNKLHTCDIHTGQMETIPASGNLPEAMYGQAIVCHGPYLYTIGGTSGHDYNCDIHRLDLRTNIWESVYICSGKCNLEPAGRYRHEVACDGKMIYILGGGTSSEAFDFKLVPAFNIECEKWTVLLTENEDRRMSDEVPAARRCHSLVQYKDKTSQVSYIVICGGFNNVQVFNDVWRLNLSTMKWTCLRKCKLPVPIYFHSAALTPIGCMYMFGGIVKYDEAVRTDAVHSIWLMIPKLSEICWMALNHYHPRLKNSSPIDLLKIGIPLKFVNRLKDG